MVFANWLHPVSITMKIESRASFDQIHSPLLSRIGLHLQCKSRHHPARESYYSSVEGGYQSRCKVDAY
jgi:hypothetical protein